MLIFNPGVAGLAIGGASGLFRSNTPGIFALASSIQCFTLGSSFTGKMLDGNLAKFPFAHKDYVAARLASLEAISQIQKKPVSDLHRSDICIASTLGGAGAGGLTATLFRGRANILPGIFVWGALGLGGQCLVDAVSPRFEEARHGKPGPSLVDRITSSKWSPMTKLSDEEYERMLKERLVRVEAEIALVEEDMAKLTSPNDSHENKP